MSLYYSTNTLCEDLASLVSYLEEKVNQSKAVNLNLEFNLNQLTILKLYILNKINNLYLYNRIKENSINLNFKIFFTSIS